MDDIESLNTDDVRSVILKKERKKAIKTNFNLKFDVFSNTFYLWIGILKTCIPLSKMTFFLSNQSQKEKQSGNNADAVLNDFTDLESEIP